MTTAAQEAPTPAARARPLWHRLVMWALIVVVIGAAANLLGWDLRGWFHSLWDTVTTISAGSLIAAILLMMVQTTATAFAWFSILRFAYPGRVKWRDVLAGYAVSVALNGILPANIGTLVFLIMITVLVGISFVAVLGAYAVEKIFFTLSGTFVYLYLFLSVSGSFDIEFGWVREHWVATAIIAAGAVMLVLMLIRILRPKLMSFWENAKHGGQVLGQRRVFLVHVVWPEFLGWAAGLCVIGVFMAAYAIPVTFHTIMSVVGGNSIANITSFTPGGVGVNQAFNVASLNSVTDATTATAYSVAQQLITTAWNQVFALAMLVWVFGWSGGKALVGESYVGAKQKAAERKQAKAKEKD
jgi:uncharacterized membrane protein YbhN (UPF0104 family)